MKWQTFLTGRYLHTPHPAPTPHIDPIEVQLDIMVHATQITERFPFTKVRSTS